MGYNRSGTRRTARLRRRKRLENRLAEKMAPQQEGVVQKVKHLAEKAAGKVGEVLHAAVEKVKHVVK